MGGEQDLEIVERPVGEPIERRAYPVGPGVEQQRVVVEALDPMDGLERRTRQVAERLIERRDVGPHRHPGDVGSERDRHQGAAAGGGELGDRLGDSRPPVAHADRDLDARRDLSEPGLPRVSVEPRLERARLGPGHPEER